MRTRFSGRKGRLLEKFKTMASGQELRVGVRFKSDIYHCAGILQQNIFLMNTEEKAQREDGVIVSVYLVSFR